MGVGLATPTHGEAPDPPYPARVPPLVDTLSRARTPPTWKEPSTGDVIARRNGVFFSDVDLVTPLDPNTPMVVLPINVPKALPDQGVDDDSIHRDAGGHHPPSPG